MLLNEIIAMATDDTKSLSSLLRKCLVLAHQIKNERLKNWANQELNGYMDSSDLPDYRVIPADAKGQFVASFGREATLPIPSLVLEKSHRHFAEKVYLFQSVSAYEALVAEAATGSISMQWQSNLVLYYRDKIPVSDGWALVRAWQEISKSTFVELLGTVRTRVLNMALEISSELGDNDENLKMLTSEKADKVEQTVTTIIYGGTNVITSGHSSVTSTINHQTVIAAGDWQHLATILQNSGVPESKVAELEQSIEADGKKTIGGRVSEWITKAAPEVLAGGVKIGAAAAQSVLTDWLKQYFGL
jgi:hypothetical protein